MNVLMVRVRDRIDSVFEAEDMTIGELVVEILRDLSPQYSKYTEVEFVYIEEIDEYTLLEYLECLKDELQMCRSLFLIFSMMFIPCTKEFILHHARRMISLVYIGEDTYEIRVSRDLETLVSEYDVEEVMCAVKYDTERDKIVFMEMKYEGGVGRWEKLLEISPDEFVRKIRTSGDLAEFLKSCRGIRQRQ